MKERNVRRNCRCCPSLRNGSNYDRSNGYYDRVVEESAERREGWPDDDRYHWYHRRASNYGRGWWNRRGNRKGKQRETRGEVRVARRPQRVKSKVKGSCGRRRVVAVKAITRHVEAAATS